MRRFVLLFACALGCGAPAPAAPRAHRIVDAEHGRAVSFGALVEALGEARVVYVGEHHDRDEDHRAQLAILEGLHAADPSLALGLEMVQAPHQAALDAYVAGEIDEPAMLERVEWERRWGDFAPYRPLMAFARAHGLPIVALNAPSEVTRAVARGGLEALDAEARAALPELDLSNEAHRALVAEALAEHPHAGPETFERFYAAQVIWDETMAERAAAFLAREGAPSRLLVVAGAMHVHAGLGIPARAARRGAAPFVIVLPVAEDDLGEALAAEPRPADFFWVTPPRPP